MTDSPTPPLSSGFEFNRPTVIALLYLCSFAAGITGIIGVVLAFVWRGEPMEDWERSHYMYLINTFWIVLAGAILGLVLMIVLIGFLVWGAVSVLVVVRCVMCILNAQKRVAMPNPETWLA